VNHWTARRRLPDLLEGGLAPESEAGLRRHVAGCRRCGRRLARLETADTLLRRLPRALVPLEAGPSADARLATLAQWSRRPDGAAGGAPYGRLEAASALATLALMVVLAASVSDWAPVMGDLGTSATAAYVVPDAPMTPLTFR
jgi:anti-sigma factor RsiW